MFKDKTIVYTSGTFDMFHYNHLRMINYARSLADILIVGVSTDELVESYKPKPIIPFHERLQITYGSRRRCNSQRNFSVYLCFSGDDPSPQKNR